MVQSSPVQSRDSMDEQVLGLFKADLIVEHHAYLRAQAVVLQERSRQRARRRCSKKRFCVRSWLTEDERVSAHRQVMCDPPQHDAQAVPGSTFVCFFGGMMLWKTNVSLSNCVWRTLFL